MSKTKTAPKAKLVEQRYPVLPQESPLQAVLGVRDRTVLEYDARWGTDVLQTLVSPETAAKFASVRCKLDDAIRSANEAVTLEDATAAVDEVTRLSHVEARGLKAMEKEATEAGRKPLDPGRAWAFKLGDGTKAVIVQTDDDARAAIRSDRFKGWAVYSLREIGVILTDRSLLGVIDAKALFPEAKVEAVKPAPNWKRGDEVGL